MEPLNRSKAGADQTEAQLIDLLSVASPTALSDGQKRSSLEAILAPRPQRVPWGVRVGRPALVFGILLCLAGASTAATLGARWMSRRAVVPATPAPQVEAPAAPVHVQARPAPVAAPVEDPPPIEPAVVELPKLRARARHPRRGEDPAALMAAVTALRQDHDPARASRLLQAYLRRYPRGSLSEEAHALSFEAARAQSSPNTADLANEYLRLYPHGRFRKAAEQAAGRADL
ncbi:MAG TPA: hypothetical protein VHG72_18000 [Polyangia bacterium]|nr:hypothetical protein [Polyangia bacterium]